MQLMCVHVAWNNACPNDQKPLFFLYERDAVTIFLPGIAGIPPGGGLWTLIGYAAALNNGGVRSQSS